MPCLYHHRLVGAAQQPVGRAVVKDATVQNWAVSQVKRLLKIGGTWGGARFTGYVGGLTSASSFYWSSTESTAAIAPALSFTAGTITPQRGSDKPAGLALRCVR